MMLKRFSNPLFSLFYLSFQLYIQVYKFIKAIREYPLNAWVALKHNNNTRILWIILLQARIFAKEKWWVQKDSLRSSQIW